MHYFISLLFLGVFFSASAQPDYIKEFTTSNGLLSNDNYMSYQDKQGYIWICSEKGIVKYDGNEFKSFTIKEGLPINDIWYFNEDSKGRLWVSGFYSGLYYIKNDRVVKHPGAEKITNLVFSTEKNDSLFFFSVRGNTNYVLLPNGKLEPVEIELGSRTIQGNNKTLQVQMPDQRIDGFKGTCCPILYNREVITQNYHSLLSLSFWNQKALDVSDDWILFNNNESKIINLDSYFGGKVVQIRNIQPSGELIIRFNDSLHVYSNPMTKERNLKLERLLSHVQTKKIGWVTKDDEENLWVSLYRGNVVLVPNDNQTISPYFSKKDDNYFSDGVLLEKDNTLLFMTKNGSLFKYTANTFELWETPATQGNVRGITANENGVVISYSDRLMIIDKNNKLRTYFNPLEKGGVPSYRSMLLSESTLIGGNFVTHLLKNSMVEVIDKSKKIEGRIHEVISIKDYVVSGSSTGTFCLNLRKNKVQKLTDYETRALLAFENKLLIGTNGAGLILMDFNGKIYAKKHLGLTINAIKVHENKIYLATNKGIYVDEYHSKSKQFKTLKVINDAYGLSSNEVTSLVFRGNELFAGTVNGFNKIDISELFKGNKPAPKIRLTKVLVNAKQFNSNSFHSFDWNQNDLEFIFTGISYYSLGKVEYKYKLVGLDDNWIRTEKRNIRFRSLPAGKYRFEVKAISSVGIESTKIAAFSFEIKQHFTKTVWFQVSILLLICLSAIAIGYFYRIRKVKRLEVEKRFSEIEMNSLRSQMNPHFIFNSLNTLQSMLFLKGQEETNDYIHDFSQLMRSTLDHSKTQLVSLEEELAYLDLFIRLEKHRLDGRLDYSINLDENIHPDEIQLPSMMIQPIVENAILHGLIPKKGNRVLELNFSIENFKLVVEIKDNGIGRKASKNREMNKDKRSWATSILAERIEVLNKLHHYTIDFITQDLYPNEVNTGTHVIIKLPISKNA